MDKKQSNTLSFKDKIKILFCAKTPSPRTNSPIVYRKQTERKPSGMKKQPRQTLTINDVFLKLSRKNIVEEEFFSHQVLNLQMERHIASRIKGCNFAFVKGEFGEESTQGIKFPIYLTEKPTKSIPYRQQIKSQSLPKPRKDTLDLVLFQTSQTSSSASTPKKPKLKPTQISQSPIQINLSQPDKAAQQEFSQILTLLQTYTGLVQNIVILCSKNIDLLDYSRELMGFGREYLFELERVRENQELVCHVVYVSRNAGFLRLSQKGFKEFIVGEMELTLEEEGRMNEILGRLMDKKYHREILNTVRLLKKDSFSTRSLFEPFIMKIGSENAQIRQLMSQMKSLVFVQEQIQETPQLIEPTPIFHSVKRSMYTESHT